MDKIDSDSKKEIEKMLNNYVEQFWKDLELAYNSGAISEDEKPLIIARAVMQITVKKFEPNSYPNYSKIKRNLEYFV